MLSRSVGPLVLGVAALTIASPVAADPTARLELAGGQIVIQLVDDTGEPLASAELPESSSAVRVELQSTGVTTRVEVVLVAVDVLGWDAGTRLRQGAHRFRDGSVWQHAFRPVGRRFEIGEYLVEAVADDGTVARIPFAVTSLHESAIIVEGGDLDGPNVALTALGGTVVSTSSSNEYRQWGSAYLLDGFARVRDRQGGLVSAGWEGVPGDMAPEVVIGFYEQRAPIVDRIVIEGVADRSLPADYSGVPLPTAIPRVVEILAANTLDPEAFEPIATVRLWNRTEPQLIAIDPLPIRYLKLRVLETWGATPARLSEVRVFEASAVDSILDGFSPNIARPALGGAVVAFTSQTWDNPVVSLVDGGVGPERGWSSADSATGSAARLPQDLVFAFRGDRIADVDRLEIDVASSPRYAVGNFDSNWPRLISVDIATDSPDGPFETLGRFELAQEAGVQTIPVGQPARYVRVRVLENYGGSATTIGEIAIIEASRPTVESVLSGEASPGWISAATIDAALALPDGLEETEPNDQRPTAQELRYGVSMIGAIDPANDVDRFTLSVGAVSEGGDGPQTLTIDVRADGPIRLALELTDATDTLVKHFNPGGRVGNRATLTWELEPADYLLSIREPERLTALVWDNSASMEGRSEALELAVRGYIGARGTNESLVLIPFNDDDDVQSLLPEPSRDTAALLLALEGQFWPDGGTHLFDALDEALEVLGDATGQRTIVALTDGQDSGSEVQLADLRRRLAQSDVRLITIGLGTDLDQFGLATASTGHGVLRSLAQAGGGHYYVEPSAGELPALYATIADEQGGRQRYAIRVDPSDGMGQLAVSAIGERIPAIALPPVTFVLDASGSMRRELDDRQMIDIARDVLIELTNGLPDDVQTSLWTFGHRVHEGRSGDCSDIEELIPLGPLDRAQMLEELGVIRARGTTPIAATLEQIGASLDGRAETHIIVVVTDGEEECRDDLVEVSEALAARFSLNLHVIGFALDEPAAEEQLAAVAAAGGGRFVNASRAADLQEAINAVLGAPFAVLDASGDVVRESAVGAPPVLLPAGIYNVRLETGAAPFVIDDVEITADIVVTIQIDRQGDEIGSTVLSQ